MDVYTMLLMVCLEFLKFLSLKGLFSRADWREFRSMPFGFIPTGTSNAMIKNLLHRVKETTTLESACFLIAKGRNVKMDLTRLETPENGVIYCCLLFAWATMANIDVGANM